MNDSVQHQIDDALWFGEFRFVQDRVGQREGDGAQGARRGLRIEPEPVLVRLEYRDEGLVEALIVRLLPSPEVLGILWRPAAEPERMEKLEDPPEPGLQNADCVFQPGFEREVGIDCLELFTDRGDVEHFVEDRVDEFILGAEDPEDGSFGDPGRLGDLPGADIAAELLQQRLRYRDERSTTLTRW